MICQSIYVTCSILAIIRARCAQGKRASQSAFCSRLDLLLVTCGAFDFAA